MYQKCVGSAIGMVTGVESHSKVNSSFLFEFYQIICARHIIVYCKTISTAGFAHIAHWMKKEEKKMEL